MVGTELSHYRILERLAAGAMGEVYLADDTKLEHRVALKIVPPELAADRVRLGRLEREAKTLAALDNPNIVAVFSIESAMLPPAASARGEPRTVHFITMQLAVAAAHARGVVHLDLKPANVMGGSDGRVKIVDFRIAKLRETEPGRPEGEEPTRTVEGCILGAVPYIFAGRAVPRDRALPRERSVAEAQSAAELRDGL